MAGNHEQKSLRKRGKILLFHSTSCNLCRRLKEAFGDRITAAVDINDPYWLPEVRHLVLFSIASYLVHPLYSAKCRHMAPTYDFNNDCHISTLGASSEPATRPVLGSFGFKRP